MSRCSGYASGMNIKYWFPDLINEAETIACFGKAKLVKKLDGTYELVGGSRNDRTAAREWISLFFHVAVREVP